MKNNLGRIAAVLAVLSFSTGAWGTVIVSSDSNNGTDVGSADTIVDGTSPDLGACGPGSSEAAEECWAEGVLDGGTDLTLSGREDPVDWYFTDDADLIAFELSFGPGYYIIKNSTTWVLMENLASIDWGVLSLGDLTALGFGSLFPGNSSGGCDPLEPSPDCMTISHVTEFNGEREVPEPGSLALLGAGLLGLGMFRRKRRIV